MDTWWFVDEASSYLDFPTGPECIQPSKVFWAMGVQSGPFPSLYNFTNLKSLVHDFTDASLIIWYNDHYDQLRTLWNFETPNRFYFPWGEPQTCSKKSRYKLLQRKATTFGLSIWVKLGGKSDFVLIWRLSFTDSSHRAYNTRYSNFKIQLQH